VSAVSIRSNSISTGRIAWVLLSVHLKLCCKALRCWNLSSWPKQYADIMCAMFLTGLCVLCAHIDVRLRAVQMPCPCYDNEIAITLVSSGYVPCQNDILIIEHLCNDSFYTYFSNKFVYIYTYFCMQSYKCIKSLHIFVIYTCIPMYYSNS